MTEPDQSEAIEGQCGTCKFAAVFGFAGSPTGHEDGVHCTCEDHAKMLDEQTGGDGYMQEYKDFEFLSLWRLEAIAEQSFRCANWQQR
jgi:hypothetical protein